jgi:MFS family permease
MLKHFYFHHYTGLSKSCWFHIFLNFFNSALIGLIYFLPLYFIQQLHLDLTKSSLIISCFGFGTILGGGIGGSSTDRFSPRFVVMMSLMIQTIAFFLLSHFTTPTALMINLLLLGAATYSFITANFIWALSYCEHIEEHKLKVIALLDSASNLGMGVSALMISMTTLTTISGLSLSASASLFLLIAYLLFYTFPYKNASTQHHSSTHWSFFSTRSIFNKILLFILTTTFLSGIIISQLSTTYSVHLNTLFPNYRFGGFGYLFALNTFLIVTLQTPVANYCRTFDRIRIIGVGVFLLGFGLFMLIFSFHFWLVILACIVYTLGEMLFFSVAQLACYEQAPLHNKGFVLGLYRMVYASSRILGPAAGAYLYQHISSTALWLACGTIGITCLLSSAVFTPQLSSQYQHTS